MSKYRIVEINGTHFAAQRMYLGFIPGGFLDLEHSQYHWGPTQKNFRYTLSRDKELVKQKIESKTMDYRITRVIND